MMMLAHFNKSRSSTVSILDKAGADDVITNHNTYKVNIRLFTIILIDLQIQNPNTITNISTY